MNDDEEDVGQPSNPEGIIDHEAIARIMEKAKDTLRPIGLTLEAAGVQLSVQPDGNLWALLPCIVRPSAKAKLEQDDESRAELNKMLAAQHEAKIQSEAELIRKIASDPEKLRDLLFGDGVVESDCLHLRRHPSGHCLDCNEGLEG